MITRCPTINEEFYAANDETKSGEELKHKWIKSLRVFIFKHKQQRLLCVWETPVPSDSETATFGPWTSAISANRFQKRRQERFSNVSLLQKRTTNNEFLTIASFARHWNYDTSSYITYIVSSKSISTKYRLDRIKI